MRPEHRPRTGLPADAGVVTAEAALGICAVVGVFAVVLSGVNAMTVQLRCTDAAVEAARLSARGDVARAGAAVSAIAGDRAVLDVLPAADRVTADVRIPLTGFTGALQAHASAVAVPEPGVHFGAADPPGGAAG
ncbi:hypothetical protein IQ251_06875 [Saccharopolyspora sp. HNM0983]|uniref:Pilus assembly protein TadE n=1 Tax=Saccharopolyspora montiporae TaxID=2781240 RepID=A0A929G105_9PSEU|nr:TadE family type IV pilus minor pilin [Saccharopolyspora sp. HNM0983]MBE9374168.1 hypothetical protein [Saccharopolyspora sp. HNM0983]